MLISSNWLMRAMCLHIQVKFLNIFWTQEKPNNIETKSPSVYQLKCWGPWRKEKLQENWRCVLVDIFLNIQDYTTLLPTISVLFKMQKQIWKLFHQVCWSKWTDQTHFKRKANLQQPYKFQFNIKRKIKTVKLCCKVTLKALSCKQILVTQQEVCYLSSYLT